MKKGKELLKKIGPGLGTGILLMLAFPPFGFALVLLVALVPWLISLREMDHKQAWKSGYGMGIWYGASQLFWVFGFILKWTGSPVYGAIPWVIVTILFAIYYGLVGMAIAKCYRADKGWMIPLVWAGMETFRSYIPILAFPWSLLAAPLGRYPEFIQGAYFGTIFLVSAALVAVNALGAEIFGKPKGRTWVAMAVWITAYLALNFGRAAMQTETKPVRVGLLQPGEDLAFGDPQTEFTRLLSRFGELLPIALDSKPDLIVMPEGITTAPTMPPSVPFFLPKSTPVLFGGQRSKKPTFQSAFLFNNQSWKYADKTRLVIFGEFVPFRQYLPAGFNLPSGDLEESKDGLKQFTLPFGKVGPILCFEALFPDIAWRHSNSGTTMIAVMSIDDWFMGTPAIEQLRTAAVWRAVETGNPIARVGGLGATYAVTGRGVVLDEAPIGPPAAMVVELPVPKKPSSFIGTLAFPVISLGFFWAGVLFRFSNPTHGKKNRGKNKVV